MDPELLTKYLTLLSLSGYKTETRSVVLGRTLSPCPVKYCLVFDIILLQPEIEEVGAVAHLDRTALTGSEDET